MSTEEHVFAKLNLEGWVAALIQTGYEKLHEFATPGGNTITVYMNTTEGKMVALVTYANSDDWVALYPEVGWWDDKFHVEVPGEGTTWVHKTAADLALDMLAELEPEEGDDNGNNAGG